MRAKPACSAASANASRMSQRRRCLDTRHSPPAPWSRCVAVRRNDSCTRARGNPAARSPAPRVVAGRRGPRVVVARLAAHVDHAVDARAAAQRLAARIQQVAAVQRGFGFGAVAPVGARIADAAQIAHGDVDPRVVVRRARFDEQHAARGIRAQTIGEQAARGARADDHVVEFGIAQVRTRVLLLVGRVGLEPTTNALKGRCSTN